MDQVNLAIWLVEGLERRESPRKIDQQAARLLDVIEEMVVAGDLETRRGLETSVQIGRILGTAELSAACGATSLREIYARCLDLLEEGELREDEVSELCRWAGR